MRGYDDTAVRPILGAYNDGIPGVPTAVALGDIDGLVPPGAGDDVRDLVRQGLAMRFGFNCDEARRNFVASAELAAERDGVGCAVCLWGIARSLMPDVNNYKTSRRSRDAARAALAAAEGAIIDGHHLNHPTKNSKRNPKSCRRWWRPLEPSSARTNQGTATPSPHSWRRTSATSLTCTARSVPGMMSSHPTRIC